MWTGTRLQLVSWQAGRCLPLTQPWTATAGRPRWPGGWGGRCSADPAAGSWTRRWPAPCTSRGQTQQASSSSKGGATAGGARRGAAAAAGLSMVLAALEAEGSEWAAAQGLLGGVRPAPLCEPLCRVPPADVSIECRQHRHRAQRRRPPRKVGVGAVVAARQRVAPRHPQAPRPGRRGQALDAHQVQGLPHELWGGGRGPHGDGPLVSPRSGRGRAAGSRAGSASYGI
jgi:hypothetical protein